MKESELIDERVSRIVERQLALELDNLDFDYGVELCRWG